MKLVAGLICGNEETRIERCVLSLKQICSDIVVVRAVGGAKPDKTLDIAAKLGCITEEYRNCPLCQSWDHIDNFSAARNQAFIRAYDIAGPEGWVMWADCDDVLMPNMVEPHQKMLRECKPEFHWIVTDYVIPEQNKRSARERFFRYKTGWWYRPVHENVQPVIDVKAWVRRDIEIVHMPPMGPRQSSERNRRILLHHDKMSSHFKFYLHYENFIANKPDEAAKYGAEALSLNDLDGVSRYETLLNCASLCSGANALELTKQAIKLEPNRREAYALLVTMLMDENKPEQAFEFLQKMKQVPVPSFPQWTHRAEWYGWKAEHLYWWCLRAMGKFKEADDLQKNYLAETNLPIITLIHATRGRPIQAIKSMNNWLGLANNPQRVEHIFVFDKDDKQSEILKRFRHIIQKNKNGFSVGAWNLGAKQASGQILVQLSDDWEPTKGWDDAIASRLDLNKAQVLKISDGYRKDNLMCMAILTKNYYEKYGLFNPKFKNVYSDNDFTTRAEKNGAIVDASDIFILHHHPIFEGTPADETYVRGNCPKEYARAKKIYESLHS